MKTPKAMIQINNKSQQNMRASHAGLTLCVPTEAPPWIMNASPWMPPAPVPETTTRWPSGLHAMSVIAPTVAIFSSLMHLSSPSVSQMMIFFELSAR
jgi:hypothetical protein